MLRLLLTILVGFSSAAIAPYKVYHICLPLVGGPKYFRLHRAVLFEPVRTSIEVESSSGEPLVLVDFLPASPQDPMNLLSLLSGNTVPGIIRCKRLQAWPPAAVALGDSISTALNLANLESSLAAEYDTGLNLYSNNCGTFADAVFRHLQLSSAVDISPLHVKAT